MGGFSFTSSNRIKLRKHILALDPVIRPKLQDADSSDKSKALPEAASSGQRWVLTPEQFLQSARPAVAPKSHSNPQGSSETEPSLSLTTYPNNSGSLQHHPAPLHARHLTPYFKGSLGTLHSQINFLLPRAGQLAQHTTWARLKQGMNEMEISEKGFILHQTPHTSVRPAKPGTEFPSETHRFVISYRRGAAIQLVRIERADTLHSRVLVTN